MKKEGLRFSYSVFIALIFLNLLFLNLWVMGYVKPLFKAASTVDLSTTGIKQNEYIVKAKSDVPCSSDCVKEIYKAIYQATASAQTIAYQSSAPSNSNASSSNSLRQFSVSLGSGTNATTTWTSVPGVAAYINTAQYGTIQSVTFQASLFVPTGNQIAYVQLYDATNQHPVWFSTMSMSGGSAQLLISSPITLDPGNNLYEVQVMSQLGFPTNLVQSSVNIVSN